MIAKIAPLALPLCMGILFTSQNIEAQDFKLRRTAQSPSIIQFYKVNTLRTEAAQSNPALVKEALADWMRLLREKFPDGLHTKVAGLEDDPECAGDLINDRILDRYFETLFNNSSVSNQESLSLLTEMARHSACLGTQQSWQLAAKIYQSFIELRGQLNTNGRREVMAWVAQAAFNPLVILYDVEKHRGLDFPLGKWFTENYQYLLDGVENKRMPAAWQRLWLYDRRSGRLVGHRNSDNPKKSDEVHLSTFIRSIVSSENLGKGDCAFTEMIGRGAASYGYACGGLKCRVDRSVAESILTSIDSDMGSPICNQQNGSADLKEQTNQADICDMIGSVDTSTTASDQINCVTQEIIKSGSPGRGLMSCVAEAPSRCSYPANSFIKQLQQSTFAGVKAGRECGLSRSTEIQATSQTQQDYDREKDRIEKEYQDKIKEQQDKMAFAIKILQLAKQKAEDAKNSGASQEEQAEANEAEVAAAAVVSDTIAETQSKAAEAAAEHNQALQKAEKERQEKQQKEQEQTDNSTTSSPSSGHCAPDAETCGNNNCSAMSDAMSNLMQCATQQTFGNNPPESNHMHGSPFNDPTAPIDPADPTGNARLSQCLTAGENPVEASINKQCWAYDCARASGAAGSGSGCCAGVDPELDGLRGQIGTGRAGVDCSSPYALCTPDGETYTGINEPAILGPLNAPGTPPSLLKRSTSNQNPMIDRSGYFPF